MEVHVALICIFHCFQVFVWTFCRCDGLVLDFKSYSFKRVQAVSLQLLKTFHNQSQPERLRSFQCADYFIVSTVSKVLWKVVLCPACVVSVRGHSVRWNSDTFYTLFLTDVLKNCVDPWNRAYKQTWQASGSPLHVRVVKQRCVVRVCVPYEERLWCVPSHPMPSPLSIELWIEFIDVAICGAYMNTVLIY